MKILLVKETRAGEERVALIPEDIKKLIADGHSVFVEQEAGASAGFSNDDYQQAGATLRSLISHDLDGYQHLFKDIDLIVRAKRPSREQETLEAQAFTPDTIMIGALDPLEKNSPHMAEYKQAGITIHSIDQFDFAADDPRNILTKMSQLAGKLALLDAIQKFNGTPLHVSVIAYGAVGQAALDEALAQRLPTTVILTNPITAETIHLLGASTLLFDRSWPLEKVQSHIKQTLASSDIIITGARKAREIAPILIPSATLQTLKPGTVIVDIALSEGGNVEGSEHDATLKLGNDVIVTNISGYPKVMPHEASKMWSHATYHFIKNM